MYPEDNTIDIDESISMADQTFRGREEIIKADAKSDLLNDFIGVLRIDVIFDRLSSIFSKVLRGDLDKVRDLGLENIRVESRSREEDIRLTRMNMIGFEVQ
jgi:hypothetical protein